MDPSITKLLEGDEEESMHSGADVEAFTAALNRDIAGDASPISQPSDSGPGVLSQTSNSTSMELYGQWKNISQEKKHTQQIQQQDQQYLLSTEPHLSQEEPKQQGSGAENQHQQINNQSECRRLQQEKSHSGPQRRLAETSPLQFVDKNHTMISKQNPVHSPIQDRAQLSESQEHHMVQQLNSQHATSASLANNSMAQTNPTTSVDIPILVQILCSYLEKDKSMQLQAVYAKLKKNEITKEDFFRFCKNIIEPQMLIQAAHLAQKQTQLQARASQHTNQQQYSIHAQASSQQLSSHCTQQSAETQKLSAFHPMSSLQSPKNHQSTSRQFHVPASVQTRTDTTFSTTDTSDQKSQEIENVVNVPKYDLQNASNGTTRLHDGPICHVANQSTLHQNSVALKQLSADMPTKEQGSSAFTSSTYVKQEVIDQDYEPMQKLQCTAPRDSSFGSWNPTPECMKDKTFERKPSRIDFATSTSKSAASQISGHMANQVDSMLQNQMRSQSLSTTSSLPAGTTIRTSAKAIIGQKKPFKGLDVSLPPASKKQKASGAFHNQSIEQLNDVTAVSGVDLREEEEQLLAAPMEESRASEATIRIVQEEEERLILQKGPLEKKLAEITFKCGINGISSDVEHCLSLCVEERMRALIRNLRRLSEQRIDIEKTRHQVVVTSDIRRQILAMNRKAEEDWEKKQAEEAEKFRKLNETEGSKGSEAGKGNGEGLSKTQKINKEDDMMRATAANVAARAAVGGDDMLLKWQLMAEQARQKREGRSDGPSCTQSGGRTSTHKTIPNFGRTSREQEAGRRGFSAASMSGVMRKSGRSAVVTTHPKIARSISTKDVISALEREPQMSRSMLIYRLYERISSGSAAESLPSMAPKFAAH